MSEPETMMINDIKYVREDALKHPPKPGKRAVVVVDRGWIFAGDVEDRNGRVYLTRAVWLFRWKEIGFARAIEDWRSDKVDIREVPGGVTDIPSGAEVFRVPVSDDWGIK